MKKEDAIHLEGVVEFNIEKNGVIVDRFIDNNLIVADGREILCFLLSKNDVDRRITQIGFGENGAAVAAGDSVLTNAVLKLLGIIDPLKTIEYPQKTWVTFPWELLKEEGNGKTYQEIGLVTANGVLFARKAFAPRIKNEEIRFFGSWTLKF